MIPGVRGSTRLSSSKSRRAVSAPVRRIHPCRVGTTSIHSWHPTLPTSVSLHTQLAGYSLKHYPGSEQTLDQSARVIGFGYGPGYKGCVCTLIMSQKGVKLGLAYGAKLPDPKGLLGGSGKVHRHVELKTLADLKQPGLKPLIKASAGRVERPDQERSLKDGRSGAGRSGCP